MIPRSMKWAMPVNIPLSPVNDSLLQRIFSEQPFLKYSIICQPAGNILQKEKEDKIISSREHFQSRVNGTVMGDSAEPLPGATVQLMIGPLC